MNYKETLEYIHSLGYFSKPASLERISLLMERFKNPQDKFHTIHIAGTNGKGSVSAMLSRVFTEAGKKTGLFISPFVINFRERIQIDGSFISEQDIIEYAQRIQKAGIEATEFEFITALAFLYFKENKCDIAIIETGLGGRLDATNVLTAPDAAVITKIGMDHMHILGNSIEDITREKCGIITKSPVITSCNQRPDVYNVINGYTDKLIIPDKMHLKVIKSDSSGNIFIYKNKKYETSLCGEHQIENALTVIETLNNCSYDISYDTIFNALKHTFFPARMEIISNNPLVVLDGAHNPDGAKVLSEFMSRYSGKITAIIGIMKDKNYRAVLGNTLIYCKNAIAVSVEGMQRSLSAEELSTVASEFCECTPCKNYETALQKARKIAEENPIFVFGSLYLASGIRENLLKFYL